jgi:hypothetical protein
MPVPTHSQLLAIVGILSPYGNCDLEVFPVCIDLIEEFVEHASQRDVDVALGFLAAILTVTRQDTMKCDEEMKRYILKAVMLTPCSLTQLSLLVNALEKSRREGKLWALKVWKLLKAEIQPRL